MRAVFSALNPQHILFESLLSERPAWWLNLVRDKDSPRMADAQPNTMIPIVAPPPASVTFHPVVTELFT
jgi:hypothetical protein